MRKPVTYDGQEMGYTEKATYFLQVAFPLSIPFKGIALPDSLIDELVDRGVENVILLIDGRGRYSSGLDDWQDYGRPFDIPGMTFLSSSYMNEG